MKKRCPDNTDHDIGVQSGDTYCYRCGAVLVESNKECQCGKELGHLDKFCPDCGRPNI